MQYEYKVLILRAANHINHENYLNELGVQRWQLVAVVPSTADIPNLYYYFIRQKMGNN